MNFTPDEAYVGCLSENIPGQLFLKKCRRVFDVLQNAGELVLSL